MIKDCTRDYVTEMLRTYAAAGMPTYEAERDRIYTEAINEYATMDAATAVSKAEAAVERATPYLLDILAVEETLRLLEQGGKSHIVRAVKAVYCVSPTRPLRRGEITDRVLNFALQCPASETTVYHWLKEARLLCATYRGLSISDDCIEKYAIFPTS